jgi:hypothetical protein
MVEHAVAATTAAPCATESIGLATTVVRQNITTSASGTTSQPRAAMAAI